MVLTAWQTFGIIAAVALGTQITRFLPFILFPDSKKPPEYVLFLGRTLPAAMMGLLVVFCFKSVPIVTAPHGLPEFVAAGVTAALQIFRGNLLLSIGGGTAVYMYLVQVVFI